MDTLAKTTADLDFIRRLELDLTKSNFLRLKKIDYISLLELAGMEQEAHFWIHSKVNPDYMEIVHFKAEELIAKARANIQFRRTVLQAPVSKNVVYVNFQKGIVHENN